MTERVELTLLLPSLRPTPLAVLSEMQPKIRHKMVRVNTGACRSLSEASSVTWSLRRSGQSE